MQTLVQNIFSYLNETGDLVMKKRLLVISFLIFICALVMGSILVEATNPKELEKASFNKYYTSIKIEEGDTLWSIEKRYNIGKISKSKEYIQDLKNINGLKSDTIHSGQYLIVAYYSDIEGVSTILKEERD